MNDRELLKKFNNLKEIKPNQTWKKSCREILYSQISASRQTPGEQSNFRLICQGIMPRRILVIMAKPVWLASVASVFILAIGIGSVYASKNSKPGDSFYIAKIISEKAQFVITFDEKDKAKLGIEFAANRAKEMIQVLKDSGRTGEVNNDKIEKLSQNFKKEISQVKSRLTTIKAAKEQTKNDDSQVFGANLVKDNQRMEIAEAIKSTAGANQVSTSTPISETEITANATSTAILETEIIANATSTAEVISQTDQMLEQAEKLFDERNLDETIDKLQEVNRAIEGSGQVKGESETASSTQEIGN